MLIFVDGESFKASIKVEKFFRACPNGGGRKEKKPVFKAEAMGIEERCGKTRKGLKVVAVGKILSGEIAIEDNVAISFPNGRTFKDSITRIEIDHKKIIHAVTGEEVGICFNKLRLRDTR